MFVSYRILSDYTLFLAFFEITLQIFVYDDGHVTGIFYHEHFTCMYRGMLFLRDFFSSESALAAKSRLAKNSSPTDAVRHCVGKLNLVARWVYVFVSNFPGHVSAKNWQNWMSSE